jgi:hypothetical protein
MRIALNISVLSADLSCAASWALLGAILLANQQRPNKPTMRAFKSSPESERLDLTASSRRSLAVFRWAASRRMIFDLS